MLATQTVLTFSIRPAAKATPSKGSPDYAAHCLSSICYRCNTSGYNNLRSHHAIYKLLCPSCSVELARLRKARQADKNKLLIENSPVDKPSQLCDTESTEDAAVSASVSFILTQPI